MACRLFLASRIGFFLLLLLVGQAMPARAANGTVYVAEIKGVINPLTAQYLDRASDTAENNGASALVVRLDTPGGLDTAMRDMTQRILNSTIPVIVYVSPPGARAASAGLFVTMAAHIAAMAPSTNIGAAHPVALGGDGGDQVMEDKVVNDAAATIRALAQERGRNADWAEDAVRQSVSITADEALKLKVIDLIAPDLNTLLSQVDGTRVMTARGSTVLQTAEVEIVDIPMSLPERLIHILADPNIAYVLLTIGTIGIIAELYNPGTFVPGTIGVISLILAFVALGNLPLNWAGVGLLALAVILFIAEVHSPGLGGFAVAGVICFLLGSLLLFSPFSPTSPGLPRIQISPWVLASVTAIVVGFFLFVVQAGLRAQRRPVEVGDKLVIGAVGEARSDLAPNGTVQVQSELWSAVAEDPPIKAGETVRVVGVDGAILRVRRR